MMKAAADGDVEGKMSNQKKKPIIPLTVMALGLLVSVIQPLTAIGESIRPGLGSLSNGIVGLALIVIGAIWTIVAAKSNNN
jgi:hypothetical protein